MDQGPGQAESQRSGAAGARYAAQQFRVAWGDRPSLLQRIVLVLIGLVALGLIIILGTVALLVGAVFVAVAVIVVLIQRGLAKLRGESGSARAPGDTLRKNVRVMRRNGS